MEINQLIKDGMKYQEAVEFIEYNTNKPFDLELNKIKDVIDNKKSFFNERTGIDYSESTKSFKRSKKVFEGYEMDGKEFKKNKDGVWLRDHLHFNKPHTGKTPSKPQELYDILIRCYCPENGLVVEPFSGSGNFAKTCIRQNKNYLGSELDKKVFDYSIANVNECGKLF
jgi:DNA modification methylase